MGSTAQRVSILFQQFMQTDGLVQWNAWFQKECDYSHTVYVHWIWQGFSFSVLKAIMALQCFKNTLLVIHFYRYSSLPFWCLVELICLSMILFLEETSSLQAEQNNFPADTWRWSLAYCLTRSIGLTVIHCAAAALCTRWRDWMLLDLTLTHQLRRSWLTSTLKSLYPHWQYTHCHWFLVRSLKLHWSLYH